MPNNAKFVVIMPIIYSKSNQNEYHVRVSDGFDFINIKILDDGVKTGVQIVQQGHHLTKFSTFLCGNPHVMCL